jgi:hypothetical protein
MARRFETPAPGLMRRNRQIHAPTRSKYLEACGRNRFRGSGIMQEPTPLTLKAKSV